MKKRWLSGLLVVAVLPVVAVGCGTGSPTNQEEQATGGRGGDSGAPGSGEASGGRDHNAQGNGAQSNGAQNSSALDDGGTSVTTAGPIGGSTECMAPGDCDVPETVPEDCAEALCEDGLCHFVARDKDDDGFASRRCSSREPGVGVVTGSDCDDGDGNVSPNAWDGPASDDFEDGCNDDIDQDCNGLVDDGQLEDGASCACAPGETGACATTEIGFPLQYPELVDGNPLGTCQLGSRECLPNGTWGQCTGAVGPGPETCDGGDNDCDGVASLDDVEDLVDANLYACDGDNDGYLPESDAVTIKGCSEPENECGGGSGRWVSNPLPGAYADCDDEAPTAFPGNIELCDDVDNDCNDETDDSPPNAPTWSFDADGDGFRNTPHQVIQQCAKPDAPPEGCTGVCPASAWVDRLLTTGDCNDDDRQVNPIARDACDGVDSDCDGSPLTGCACNENDEPRLCLTHPGLDDVGTCRAGVDTCIGGKWTGCVGSVGPVDERCGTADLDCDDTVGNLDEDAVDLETYACDADGDGHLPVSDALQLTRCTAPTDTCGEGSGVWVARPQPGLFDDCDDADTLRYPGKSETCDGIDNDCDGDADDFAIDAIVWSYDPDGDGFRSPLTTTRTQCAAPTSAPAGCVVCTAGADVWTGQGAALPGGDCDETNSSINRSGIDQCDGTDWDCDGSAVSGCACTVGDPPQACGEHPGLDGFGICQAGSEECVGGQGGGCIGSKGPEYERCGTTDWDCDGTSGNSDTDAVDGVVFACDEDNDGYLRTTGALTTTACESEFIPPSIDNQCAGSWIRQPATSRYTDCNDANSAVSPAEREVCDGVDNNCNGQTDTDAASKTVWSYDADGDGYRNSSYVAVTQCFAPTTAPTGCAGCPDGAQYWVGGTGALAGGDCADANIAINPLAADRCDGTDYNCDGSALTGCACTTGQTPRACQTHTEDGTGVCKAGTEACIGGVWGSCIGAVGPTTEQCGTVDYDCDGTPGNTDSNATGKTTFTCDADGDGYIAVSGAATTTACSIATITAPCAGAWRAGPTTGTDCGDTNPRRYLGATELCGNEDLDCDNTAGDADADAVDRDAFVCDADADGRLADSGTPLTVTACEEPSSGCPGDWLRNPGSSFYDDCDDGDGEVSPAGAAEVCDGKDNDCDAQTDALDSNLTGWPSNPGTSYECTAGDWAIPEDGCPVDALHCDDDVYNGCETDATSLDDCRVCGNSCDFSCGPGDCVEVTKISAGDQHSCAVLTDGRVACWGSGNHGRLGDGETNTRTQPIAADILSSTSFVSLGARHSCAIADANAKLYCWGDNALGQLGLGSGAGSTSTQPTALTLTNLIDVSAGYSHTCAVRNNGELYCWGSRENGRLGDFGDSGTQVSPVLGTDAVTFAAITDASVVATGFAHTCFADGPIAGAIVGSVYCAGDDTYGQHGNGGTSTYDNLFNKVTGLSGVTAVSAGVNHTCAISGGNVWCWGSNALGQVGKNKTTALYTTPQQVAGLTGATLLAAGDSHTCVVRSGQVLCWGANSRGQLGNAGADTHLPQTIPGLTGVTGLASSGSHVCAQQGAGGLVSCWGSNDSGQLGNGSTNTNANITPFGISPLQEN